MSLYIYIYIFFFFYRNTYLELKSTALSCLKRDVEKFGTFPAFQETKDINNKFKTESRIVRTDFRLKCLT